MAISKVDIMPSDPMYYVTVSHELSDHEIAYLEGQGLVSDRQIVRQEVQLGNEQMSIVTPGIDTVGNLRRGTQEFAIELVAALRPLRDFVQLSPDAEAALDEDLLQRYQAI